MAHPWQKTSADRRRSILDAPPRAAVKDFLLAAALQELEMVCYFIETEGLHPDATWGGRPTALCYGAMMRNLPMLDYLVSRGASVGFKDGLGMTPLHYAALSGCECCIAYLVGRGTPLNSVNCAGKTPLALARCTACRELLWRYGASLEAEASRPVGFH